MVLAEDAISFPTGPTEFSFWSSFMISSCSEAPQKDPQELHGMDAQLAERGLEEGCFQVRFIVATSHILFF